MADNKKGFILYADLIHTIEKMPIEKAGELFIHILNYVNDKNPISKDLIINLTFEPIKQQLKRDLIKWGKTTVERSKSGYLGGIKSGEIRKQKKANEANALILKQNEANEAVTVNVNDNVNDNVNKKIFIVKDKILKVKEEKIEVFENVFLTENQIIQAKEFFLNKYDEAISILSNYKLSSGKKYKSDYHALIGWVKEKIKKEINNGKQSTNDFLKDWASQV